jgi:hypothetical protein
VLRIEIGQAQHEARGDSVELYEREHGDQLALGRDEDDSAAEALSRGAKRSAGRDIHQANSILRIRQEPRRRKACRDGQVP